MPGETFKNSPQGSEDSNDKNSDSPNSFKKIGSSAKDKITTEATKKGVANKVGSKVAKEGIASKAGSEAIKKGTGATSPQSAVAGGAKEAASALKNKDAMGAVDAGVRTGAVVGATAVGGTLAGSATDFVLKTKVGRKLTRLVSTIIAVNVVLMVSSFLLLILVVGGAVAALVGGLGNSGPSLYDPAQVKPITDPPTLKIVDSIIIKNISKSLPIDDAVLATMDYLSNSDDPKYSIDTFYANIAKNKVPNSSTPIGVDSTGKTIYGAGAPTSNEVPSGSATSVTPWNALPIIDPGLIDPNNDSPTLTYALFYETSFKTVVNELKTNPALKSHSGLANQVSDWTPALQSLVAELNVLSNGSIANPFDANGNLITPGVLIDLNSKFSDGPPLAASYGFDLQRALNTVMNGGLVCSDGRCNGQCETIAEYVYHTRYVFATANTDWAYMVTHGYAATADSANGMNPPVGALMFWNPAPQPGKLAEGHVAVYLGNGIVLSQWDTGDGQGVNIRQVKASRDFNSRWPYLGWAYPSFPKIGAKI